ARSSAVSGAIPEPGISARCSSAAARRTNCASRAAWAASTRACSRSSLVSVKVTQVVSKIATRTAAINQPAESTDSGYKVSSETPGSDTGRWVSVLANGSCDRDLVHPQDLGCHHRPVIRTHHVDAGQRELTP